MRSDENLEAVVGLKLAFPCIVCFLQVLKFVN